MIGVDNVEERHAGCVFEVGISLGLVGVVVEAVPVEPVGCGFEDVRAECQHVRLLNWLWDECSM